MEIGTICVPSQPTYVITKNLHQNDSDSLFLLQSVISYACSALHEIMLTLHYVARLFKSLALNTQRAFTM